MTMSVKEQFARDGYVVLPKLFSGEYVLNLKDEAKKVLATFRKNNTGVYVGMTIASEAFKEAAAYPPLIEALKEVIGHHVVFLSDKIVFKDSSTDFGSPWHQDYPYWFGCNKISVWVAFDEATKENGCLRVIPGSHLQGMVNHDGDASDGLGFDNRLDQEDVDPAQIVDLPASQGDAIIFHDLLLHSSFRNTTGQDRWALISTYKDGTLEDLEYSWARGMFTVCS